MVVVLAVTAAAGLSLTTNSGVKSGGGIVAGKGLYFLNLKPKSWLPNYPRWVSGLEVFKNETFKIKITIMKLLEDLKAFQAKPLAAGAVAG